MWYRTDLHRWYLFERDSHNHNPSHNHNRTIRLDNIILLYKLIFLFKMLAMQMEKSALKLENLTSSYLAAVNMDSAHQPQQTLTFTNVKVTEQNIAILDV